MFLASEAARMWHLHIWQGIVRLTYTGHSNDSVLLGFFCHVEHCLLTTCNVWHEGLPDHFRPCQNTWAPHYAAARDWLKSKGVSALTDRSGVVYFTWGPTKLLSGSCADGTKKKTDMYTHHRGSLCADRMKKRDKYTHHNGSLCADRMKKSQVHTPQRLTLCRWDEEEDRQVHISHWLTLCRLDEEDDKQVHTHTPQRLTLCRWDEQEDRQVHTHHKGSLCADETKKTDKYTHTTKAYFVQMRHRKRQTSAHTHTHTPQRLTLCRWDEQEDRQVHTHHKGSLCADETKKTDKYTHTTKAHFVQMRHRRRQTSTHTPQRLTLHRRDKLDGCAASQWHCTTQPHPAAGWLGRSHALLLTWPLSA